jgi:hypothetical protein
MSSNRMNLSFNLERENDLKVFNILTEQKYKTDFVIKAVIKYLEETNRDNDKEIMKEAMREVLKEYGTISIDSSLNAPQEALSEELPPEIFDMFNNL